MQEVETFYALGPQPAPVYSAYFFWLGHGFSGRWQPQLQSCSFQFLSGQPSPTDFQVAISAWGIIVISSISYSLRSGRKKTPTP